MGGGDVQSKDSGPSRFAVLDVFGLTLEVSNPRLAELLTMDASEAMLSNVRDLLGVDRREVSEALPDVMIALPTPRSEAAARQRAKFRDEADELGADLGFTVENDGTWTSPAGIDILTRTVERPLTVAAAAHYVSEVAVMTERLPENAAVLFIVADQQTADVFKVAIRQARFYHRMRTAAMESLTEAAAFMTGGKLDHRDVLLFLAPVANIDVGEMMSVFCAGSASVSEDEA